MSRAKTEAPPRSRFDRLDALRGVAMVWMALFHFSYDLNYFGFIHQDFRNDPLWTLQRTCIVTLFLLCAGAGQAVADAQGQPLARFWKRWAQVAGCALLVSAGSWFVFPDSYISFGVLHGIAAMLIVVRFSTSWGAWRWLLGLIAIALPQLVQSPFFDTRATNWIGLMTKLPVTEDYVPVLPWLGVMWVGATGIAWLIRHRPVLLSGPLARALAPLAWLGRWSLSFYMTHQLVLLGAVGAVAWLLRRPT
ncbi:MAG: heparan-alpha-glucosaminide N-acetyltransferase [Caldimonas sp.]